MTKWPVIEVGEPGRNTGTTHTKQRRALVITRNLPPLVGGMERLIWNMIDQLAQDFRVHVIGPKGCTPHLPPGVSASEIPVRPMPVYLALTKVTAIVQSLRWRPQIVIAGSGLVAPFAWLAARLTGARYLAYLHGLDVETDHPLYRRIWHPFLRRCDCAIVNSNFTRQLAVGIGIADVNIVTIHPGVDLPDDDSAEQQRAAFRARYRLDDSPTMLYVGRITPRKGLAQFVANILPRIVAEEPNAQLLVIGAEPSNSVLNSQGEQTRVSDTVEHLKLQEHVEFLGERAQNDSELDAAYFASDVLVFPVQYRPHDNEGFGMVAIEAAAHGLPTVAFAVGGVPDAILDPQSGRLVAPGDDEGFANAVLAYLRSPQEQRRAQRVAARQAITPFQWTRFGEELRKLCALDEREGSS